MNDSEPIFPGRPLSDTEALNLTSLLMLSDRPLSAEELARILEPNDPPSAVSVEDELQRLSARRYPDFPQLELVKVAQGWRYQIVAPDGAMVHRLYNDKPPRYSRAVLETLAIIAWRGPVTRGDIESIRGVTVSSVIIRTLLERDWVEICGHRETLGRPELLSTTVKFLDDFNIKSLDDLPAIDSLLDQGVNSADGSRIQEDLDAGLRLKLSDESDGINGNPVAPDGIHTDPVEVPG